MTLTKLRLQLGSQRVELVRHRMDNSLLAPTSASREGDKNSAGLYKSGTGK
jgi:hypothetical protein